MLVSRSGTNLPGGRGGRSMLGASSTGTASSDASPSGVGASGIELLVVVDSTDEVVTVDPSTTVFVGSTSKIVAMGTPVVVAPAATTGSTAGVVLTGLAAETGATVGVVVADVGAGVVTGKGAVATGGIVTGGSVARGCVAGGGGEVTTAASPSGLSCAFEVLAVPTQLEKTTPRTEAVTAALREREVMGIVDSRTGEKGSCQRHRCYLVYRFRRTTE